MTNQPSKSNFLLGLLSYLFNPIVLGLDYYIHGPEVIRQILVALLESHLYKTHKSENLPAKKNKA
jgi:hypothetical protein